MAGLAEQQRGNRRPAAQAYPRKLTPGSRRANRYPLMPRSRRGVRKWGSLRVALALSSCYASPGNIREGPMIHHLSIAARDPQHVARVLAELMGGKAGPFPPNPGSFFALQLDDHGSGGEVYPAGTQLQPAGGEGGSFVRKPPEGRGCGATPFALSVAADAGNAKHIA